MSETLIVNLFGGPGTGKSTVASQLFSKLKVSGYDTELAHEYAKDLTWENRTKALQFQPYVISKQMYRIWRLQDQVDVVVTDSPILLGLIYGTQAGYNVSAFEKFIVGTHDMWRNLNIYLVRNSKAHPYNARGRNQTEAEAQEVDKTLRNLLHHYSIPYLPVTVQEGDWAAEIIFDLVKAALA